MGQNHYFTEDDWYEGYFIPKNTIIMMNLWAMHYDPEFYPEPEKVGAVFGMGLDDSINRRDSRTMSLLVVNMQLIQMLMNATTSRTAAPDEYGNPTLTVSRAR